ncbi:MAG: SPFH/Band 7/PHB domain protein [Candidatus Margulisbacteria bacterium]|jgi:regulator of protease activity HflC (stomatin/prohibitin superfamily)|nr:SPFH/Band 7/PHB domain protein [Candidatus Margulisiibacteriota bacterium]
MLSVILVLFVLALTLLISGIKIVPQSYNYVIERLGAFHTTWKVGFHFKIPFVERVANVVSLKEALFDYEPQPVITKDNVTILVDTVVFYQISDPKLYTYGAENPRLAIEKLTLTTLRNVIGELELDETLTSRDTINGKLRSILDEATDAWGIKVNRVEVKNIDPPASVKEAMEKQMRAEREKRAAILTAEGLKEAAILKAEGEKQALILQAEAQKKSTILAAEGEAQSILEVQKATADGLTAIKKVLGDEGVIKLKSLETMQKVADGKSTKIIIPSDMQSLAGLITSVTEIAKP